MKISTKLDDYEINKLEKQIKEYKQLESFIKNITDTFTDRKIPKVSKQDCIRFLETIKSYINSSESISDQDIYDLIFEFTCKFRDLIVKKKKSMTIYTTDWAEFITDKPIKIDSSNIIDFIGKNVKLKTKDNISYIGKITSYEYINTSLSKDYIINFETVIQNKSSIIQMVLSYIEGVEFL